MSSATGVPVAARDARHQLRQNFEAILRTNERLNRSLVSFQANRSLRFFGWMKYKEAFSARLVDHLLDLFGNEGGVLLDPFAGVGTALFVAQQRGMNGIGIELLPIGFQVMQARLAAAEVSPQTFQRKVNELAGTDWADLHDTSGELEHISITRYAFPPETERAIAGYRVYCARRIRDPNMRRLFELAGLAVLESVSFTRKDGQYLRWDRRAGKPRVKAAFDKGPILTWEFALSEKLRQIDHDLRGALNDREDVLFPLEPRCRRGILDLRRGSCLEILPELKANSVDLVITSPPYCNRYDYTRTYALELIYLGLGTDEVRRMRQAMLSCTVENRAKDEELQRFYAARNRLADYQRVSCAFAELSALHEVLDYLDLCGREGRLNNANIPRMVRNYFKEMAFVVFELARVLRRGGRIVMVNDNVQYMGEEVPVDLILSEFARRFGLAVESIWVLPRGKGNSSQQMGVHGRSELRKCVYVWRKP